MTESSTVPIIQAAHLGKTFRTLKRKSGFVGAIQNLFSTDGVLIFFSVQLLMVCLSFWFINTVSLMQTMSWMCPFGQYPVTIFAPPLQFLFSWVLPDALTGFYPAAFVLRGTGS